MQQGPPGRMLVNKTEGSGYVARGIFPDSMHGFRVDKYSSNIAFLWLPMQ